ncbi:hypothetical protein VMD_24490 [Vibrio mimicus VM573]|nr:hypothetical protein VMD_24490 [Vibrio mimicus VM573]
MLCVPSPNESWWLRLLCLSLVLCVVSPLGGRYIYRQISGRKRMKLVLFIALIFSTYLQADSSIKVVKTKTSSKATCETVEYKLWKTHFVADEICKYSSSKCINNAEENIPVVCDSPKVSLCYEERRWLKSEDFVGLSSKVAGKGNVTKFNLSNGIRNQQFCVFHK